MKKNSLIKNAGASFLTLVMIAGVFTSFNNTDTTNKPNADSLKMQTSIDSSKMMNTTVPKMVDSPKSLKDTDTKSDQTPPPRN